MKTSFGPWRLLSSNGGFSLVEMVVVCLIFVIVIGLTGDAFNRIISKSLTLTKSAESNITGMVGLELMRSDLQAAGCGLPWSFSQAIAYDEAAAQPGVAMNALNSVPRAVISINNISSTDRGVVFDGTDTLAIRGQTLAPSAASKHWSYVESQILPTVNPTPAPYHWDSENLSAGDNVIVTAAVVNMAPANQLVVSTKFPGRWNTTFSNYSTIGKPPAYSDAEKKSDAYVIYGLADASAGLTSLRMPFNRADYYVRSPKSSDPAAFSLPARCNPSAGTLFKGVVSQSDGAYSETPILDCVLDMQVVYAVQNPPGSATLTDVSDVSAFSAQDLRDQLKEIKVYILAQDGARDLNYSYPNATVGVGPGNGITSGSGRTYDFAANGVPNWRNYHWRVYQVIARPNNLAGNAAQ